MRITVLGKSPAWQDAGGACSGYLVEGGGTRLLLDCGPGVLGSLRAHCDYADVDSVVISHLHADHFLDLLTYASALTYGPRWSDGGGPRPTLHAPAGAHERFAALCEAGAMKRGHIESAFDVQEYDPAERLELGGLRVRFQPVPHYVPTQAVEVAEGERRFTFGADSGPSDELAAFARDSDLLMLEAAISEPDEEPRGHLTPAEAGEHARRAGARRLLLTHITDEVDGEAACAAASEAFGAAVEMAHQGTTYDV